MKKAFKNSSSSRSVFMRDIKSFSLRPYPALQACGVTRPEGVRGFTLIELLVVVLIIGILAAIALPQYEKAVMKSRVAEVRTIVRAMMDGTSLCFLENGQENSSLCNALSREEFPNFEAPTPLLYEDDCPDGGICFETKYWNYNSDDGYSLTIRYMPAPDKLFFYSGTDAYSVGGNFYLECLGDLSVCKALGFTNCTGSRCIEP